MIDPNVGFITQPLGHLAAMNLLHGHLPWWNYFEGLGQPLVGEMQAAALFPLTLLFALSSGLLWFHISLEVIAGVSTYFLARRLGVPAGFATVGGVLFALNGTYAWLGNAVLNPIAFIPMLLLGIEMIYDSAEQPVAQGLVPGADRPRAVALLGLPRGRLLQRALLRRVGRGATLRRAEGVPRHRRDPAGDRGIRRASARPAGAGPLLRLHEGRQRRSARGDHRRLGAHVSEGRADVLRPLHLRVALLEPGRGRLLGRHRRLLHRQRVRPRTAGTVRQTAASPASLPRRLDAGGDPRIVQHPLLPHGVEPAAPGEDRDLRALHHAELRIRASSSWRSSASSTSRPASERRGSSA